MTTEHSKLGKSLEIVGVILLIISGFSFFFNADLNFQSGIQSSGGRGSISYLVLSLFSSLQMVLQSIAIGFLCLFASRKV